jgi:hypothetical protein
MQSIPALSLEVERCSARLVRGLLVSIAVMLLLPWRRTAVCLLAFADFFCCNARVEVTEIGRQTQREVFSKAREEREVCTRYVLWTGYVFWS